MADESTLGRHLAGSRDALGRAARELLGLGVVAPTLHDLLGHASLTRLIESVVPESAPRRLPVPILSPREMDLRAKADRAAAALAGERLAFMRAVLGAPDDDAPRLVLADRLDEWGGPDDVALANLIRLSIAYDRLPAITAPGERESLSARVGHAQGRVARRVWGPFPSSVGFHAYRVPTGAVRGFPEGVHFYSMAHALRWARAVGTWLPVRVASADRPWPILSRNCNSYWEEGLAAPWPANQQCHLVPPEVFRYLAFPRPGELKKSGQPTLQRLDDGTGRRYAIYGSTEDARADLARALADHCRAAAGYAPRNNPRPLPH